MAVACNDDAPVHPILQGHEYDELARTALSRDATTIAVARFSSRLDLVFEAGQDQGSKQNPVYVFELREGWKAPLPARLSVDGYWISCDLSLQPGAYVIMFLDGSTPLYVMDTVGAEVELAALGDIEWFYTQGGELVRPELIEDTTREPARPADDANAEAATADPSADRAPAHENPDDDD